MNLNQMRRNVYENMLMEGRSKVRRNLINAVIDEVFSEMEKSLLVDGRFVLPNIGVIRVVGQDARTYSAEFIKGSKGRTRVIPAHKRLKIITNKNLKKLLME